VGSRALQRAFERLELHEGKLSRAVPWGLGSSNAPRLPGGGGGNATSLPGAHGNGPEGTSPGAYPTGGRVGVETMRKPLSVG
jgi:hypothetical protein